MKSIEEIESLRILYENRICGNDILITGSTPLFYEWYNEAMKYFALNIDSENEYFKKFKSIEVGGNEYCHKESFRQMSTSYSVLIEICKKSHNSNIIMNTKKVFIVHGHDDKLLIKVENLLYQLELTPIVLNQQVNEGLSLLDKLKKNTDVGYAIILYTPCDKGKDAKSKGRYHMRARQNVVFEHGFLISKLGSSRIAIIKEGNIEMPSDISGVVYVESEEWRYKLADEMRKAGLDVDKNKIH